MKERSAGRGAIIKRVVIAFVGVLILAGFGCVFSPQTASKATSGVPPQRVQIIAKQWEFVPNEIHVKVGMPVELVVTSVDVDHGIQFADMDVPVERVPAGRTVTIRFIPDKPGTYHFECAVVCGLGHDQMRGTLISE